MSACFDQASVRNSAKAMSCCLAMAGGKVKDFWRVALVFTHRIVSHDNNSKVKINLEL